MDFSVVIVYICVVTEITVWSSVHAEDRLQPAPRFKQLLDLNLPLNCSLNLSLSKFTFEHRLRKANYTLRLKSRWSSSSCCCGLDYGVSISSLSQ